MQSAIIVQYSITIVVLFILVWFITIKLLYPFWNLQPVLHPYDFVRHIYFAFGCAPFTIWKNGAPLSQKFIDIMEVKTVQYDKISDPEKQATLTLLRRKYIESPNVLFLANDIWLDNLVAVGHNQSGFISIAPVKGVGVGVGGCCVSYPIFIRRPQCDTVSAYYMDLFTVDTVKPQTLFQTHQYGQQHGNPLNGGNITFFKKEVAGYLGILPFAEGSTFLYPILQKRFHSLKGKLLPVDVDLRMVSKKGDNAHYLMEFMESAVLDINLISVGFSAILNWVALGYWFVFIMVSKEDILAIYFFRDTQLQYEDYSATDANSRCIELVGSYNNIVSGDADDLFYTGFILAVRDLCTKINLDYRLIQIGDISGANERILERWKRKNSAIMKTWFGYYFFNYCWKCRRNGVLILC